MPAEEAQDSIELSGSCVDIRDVDDNSNRMVLEPKFADYGSIGHIGGDATFSSNSASTGPTTSGGGPHATTTTTSGQSSGLPSGIIAGTASTLQHHLQQCSMPSFPSLLTSRGHHHGDCGTSANANMTQDDMYQRKPLLPAGNGSGGGGGKHSTIDIWGSPTSVPEYYGDGSGSGGGGDDDENNILTKNGGDSSSANGGVIKINMPAPVREEPRYPQERWKTLLAAIILFFNFVLVLTSLALVHERVPDRNVYGPLPDVFHDAVPAQDWGLDVSEYILIISFNSAIMAVLLHKHRFIVARRAFLIMSLLYMYRSITMYVTVMPISSSTYYCSPKSNHTSPIDVVNRIVQLFSGMGLSINGKHTYCGDYIYSGHTVILVFSYLIISEYTPKKLYVVHWAYGLLALTGVNMLMIAHGHYTVDVIIAYYVTTRLFWIYHTLANNANLKQHSPNNLLGRSWWFRVFLYFEGNVGGVVPRQWPDWPFPRPRRLQTKSRES